MANFDQAYSACYNLLYADKNYDAEASYVDALIKKYSKTDSKKLLDIGCGTGRHAAALASRGYLVCGIDRSKDMIEQAVKAADGNSALSFKVASADDFAFDTEFDVVTSLFHVMSYITDNFALKECFHRACRHLRGGGVYFRFLVWTCCVASEVRKPHQGVGR